MGANVKRSHNSSDLLVLADTAEMVVSKPLLLDSHLEDEVRRLRHAWSAKAKRSPRARKISKILEKAVALTGKKRGRQEGGVRKKKKKIRGTLLRGGSVAAMKRELPVEARSRITGAMSGTDVKLILQKKLTVSDTNRGLGRFSIPSSLVLTNFLNKRERRYLDNGGVIAVPVIEPRLGDSNPTLSLKRWKMSKPLYVLSTGWNALARNNSLKAGELIQVWSFRSEGRIRLAIVKCGDTAASPSSVLEFPHADQELE